MKLTAIDPGSERSGLVIYEPPDCGTRGVVLDFGIIENEVLLARLYKRDLGDASHMAIELVNVFGHAGAEVYRTCIWHGRFVEAWGATDYTEITRNDVKINLCGTARSDDADVRAALIARWGGKALAIGGEGRGKAKTPPGPLHGIASHAWSALAVAVTWCDLQRLSAEQARKGAG